MLSLGLLAACDASPPPPEDFNPTPMPVDEIPASIDFVDGNTGFLHVNTGAIGTDPDTKAEIDLLDNARALKIYSPSGLGMFVGINMDGLLGSRVTDVKSAAFEIYAEYPGGNFSPVRGQINALSGDIVPFAESDWTVYLESRNPNRGIFEFNDGEGFTAGAANILEFTVLVNGPAEKGEAPAIIYIKSIAFLDASGATIPADTGAGWAGPAGYGEEALLAILELPNPPPHGDPGGWQTWFTPGVDGFEEDYMPSDYVAASIGIVIEMEKPESFEFVYMGAFNNWDWTQKDVVDFWADGALTIYWTDIGFDTRLVTEDDNAVKLAMGNWGEVPISNIYLMIDSARAG